MKKYILTLVLIIIIILSCNKNSETSNLNPLILSQPVLIEDDDWKFEGTQNLILVPENRNEPESRKIALQFFKFPAKNKSSLAPVVFLGAGPGEPYSVDVFFKGSRAEAWRYELNFVNQNRDVILINQRGNSSAPGLQISEFRYKWNNGGTLDQPFDLHLMNQNRKVAYKKYSEEYTEKGIDLRGYDILHFIDDIEDIRKHFNYEKLALIGNSFASQWGLGYIQRYPNNVDRALFSGIEPLDHNYDDPDEIWEVLKKINEYAKVDPTIASEIPDIGLIEAFKTIISRLEEQPVSVTLKDDNGNDDTIVIGADDLRISITNPNTRTYVSDIESWPKYITEMYNGDFRVLASASMGRIYNSSSLMINPLINNSLGISEEREQLLNSRVSRKWLGEINESYISTRNVCIAPKVSKSFRQHVKHEIPIILIQGDMDMSTPYQNAVFLMDYLENGHLLTVKRGFHNAKRALIFADPKLTDNIFRFMNIDFEKESFQDFKASLPSEFELPKFKFWPIKGKSLFEMSKN